MTKRLISVGLFALTAGTLWSLSRQLQRRGRHDTPRAKPVPVQTWEGEGGALPATGAQMGPDPVVPASNPPARSGGPGTVH
ncbi:MAG TPA: hypothetical protein VJ743_13270 [Albitalea sp.]|nr:hypothetical protein [Albitalea sp.]